MKKILALMVLVSGVAGAGEAFGRGHCRGLQQDSCQQNYMKAQAYKYLLEVEGDASNAKSALNVVTKISEEKRIPLEHVVGNYTYLMDQMGGRIFTNVAQKYLTEMAVYVGRREKLVDVVDAYVEVYKANGRDLSGALTTVRILMKGVANQAYYLRDGVDAYIDMLNVLGGPIFLNVADKYFGEHFIVRGEYSTRELLGAFIDLYDALRDPSNTNRIFALVLRGAAKCGSLVEATDDYISLLNSLGGANWVNVAERDYKELFGL